MWFGVCVYSCVCLCVLCLCLMWHHVVYSRSVLGSEEEAAASAASCSAPNRFLIHVMDVSDACVHLCVSGVCVCISVCVCCVCV